MGKEGAGVECTKSIFFSFFLAPQLLLAVLLGMLLLAVLSRRKKLPSPRKMSNFWTQANQILAKVDSHFGHFKKIRREPGQKPLETETKADKSRCIYMYLGNKGQGWRKRRGRGAYNPPDFRRIEGAAGQWHVASPHYYLPTQIFKP
jgi:hypothetical protein